MNNLEKPRKTMQKTSNNLENHRQCVGKNELCGAFSRAKKRKTLGPWSLACPGLCTCGAAGPPGIPLASSAAPRASGSWSPWKHFCPVQPRKLRRLVHACNTFTPQPPQSFCFGRSAAGKRNFLPSVCVALRGVEKKTHKHSVVGTNRKAL